MISIILGICVSYLMGAVPTAYLFGKALRGIDIRQHGSGNVGATNVFRVLGKGPGICVLLIDIAKGILPLTLVARFLGVTAIDGLLLFAVSAVCGHNWTIFLNFKGGKGIATSCGVLIGLAIQVAVFRPVLLGVMVAWLLTFVFTAIVSVSSMVAALILPILMVLTGQEIGVIVLGAVFCVFVILRHRANIRRILDGNESKVPLPFHSSSHK